MNTSQASVARPGPRGGAPETAAFPARYARFGTFQLDLQKQELFKHGARVKLQGKVCQALLALVEKPGDVVTREELTTKLWPAETHVNYDANVNTTVNKLRQVLGDSTDQPAYVETIPRRGYSFVAQVEYGDEPASRILTVHAPKAIAGSPANACAGQGIATGASSVWLKAGATALVIAGMLFGAAIILLLYRAV